MRLAFGPDDDDGFYAARNVLLPRFERWLADVRLETANAATKMAGEAGLALDWKWSYSDGHLGRWRTQDIAEFLVDWCPRKLSMSPDDCLSIPGALAAWTAFLASEGLLAGGSSPVAALAEAAAGLQGEFVAAMGDSSNFGLAKSLFGAADAAGVDMTDPQQLQDWIEAFNASPEQDRRRIIPDTALALPARPALPPVVLPNDAEITASKEAAPILALFGAFATYVGEGRKLTQTGNLTLADARALVELLGTGDAMDQQIGDRRFKTVSSAELPQLRLIFAWARKAGMVRVTHGRVIATKKGAGLAKNLAGCFDGVVDALLAIGPLAAQRQPEGWLAWPEVNKLLDRFVIHLLTGPYLAQRPVPIENLIRVAADAVLNAFEFQSLNDEQVARRVGIDVVDIMDVFALAGVVGRAGMLEPPDGESTAGWRRHGGTVELTAAGMATTHRLLLEAGFDVPTAGQFTQSTATELILGAALDDLPMLWGEAEAWRRGRTPAQAATDLATAVRELQDPALRNLALVVMGDMDLDVAAPEVRRLATEPETRGVACCWLVDRGLEEPQALFDPDDVSWFVDVLAQRLVTAGSEGLCETLALAGSIQAQIGVIGRLWRSPSSATDSVLAAIGEVHPAKGVAKAARKAGFQRRSWLGGL